MKTLSNIGIKEITDFYDLADAFIDAYKKAKANDGKVNGRDFALFLGLPFKVADAFTGVEEIPAEFRDIDDSEALELEARNAKFVKDARYATVVRHLMQAGVIITDIANNPSAQA